MRTAITNGYILTLDKENKKIKNGTVVFEDNMITYVGDQNKEIENIDTWIDAKGNIVMPGLINTHGHSPMSLLRGYGDDLPLQAWLKEKIWPKEGEFTEKHIEWGSKLSVIEMLKSGTTTFSDMYIFMDVVAQVVDQSGIRANLSRGILGFGTEEQQKQKVIEAKEFARSWINQANGRITTMMSPHSSYTCSPQLIKDIAEAASEINIPIQIHLSETSNEVEQHIKEYGLRPVEHLLKLGLFENRALVAHAVHVNHEEIQILRDMGTKVSHNPGSNLKLGSGIAPIPEMIRNGITVSLGTDSASSNNNLDMFEEIRLASLIHKGKNEDPLAIPADLALKMGTTYGAESLFIDSSVGSLEIGKKADIIIIDTNQPHFHPLFDPISHLAYSGSGKDVKDVFVDGKHIVKDRELLTLDEEKVIYEVDRLVNGW